MFEKIKALIGNYVAVDPDSITVESRFIEDLNFNSYDFMSMLGELECELGVMVDEQDVLELYTVGDAAEYLEKLVNNG